MQPLILGIRFFDVAVFTLNELSVNVDVLIANVGLVYTVKQRIEGGGACELKSA